MKKKMERLVTLRFLELLFDGYNDNAHELGKK